MDEKTRKEIFRLGMIARPRGTPPYHGPGGNDKDTVWKYVFPRDQVAQAIKQLRVYASQRYDRGTNAAAEEQLEWIRKGRNRIRRQKAGRVSRICLMTGCLAVIVYGSFRCLDEKIESLGNPTRTESIQGYNLKTDK